MRTRTLLLLAVGCGLAILLAGAVLLLQLSGQDEPAAALSVGATGRAGDAVVTVDDVVDDGTTTTVTVTLSGVDDPDGVDGFALIAGGRALVPTDAGTCDGFSVAARTCTLAFDTSAVDTGSRVLVLRRAEQQVRWSLTRR